VVAEVSTRRCRTRYERAELLARSLLFARLHLQPVEQPGGVPPTTGGRGQEQVALEQPEPPEPSVSREVARPTV